MDSAPGKGGKMVERDEHSERAPGGDAAMAALHQCELIQNMIEISISSLRGLRTKCAVSNDLTQQEIRTLEVKLVKYICKQLQCKRKVPQEERPQALDGYPRLADWLRIINLRPELIEALPAHLSLDTLLHMPSPQVLQLLQGLGSSSEDCSKLTAALSCLRSATESEGELKDDVASWMLDPKRRDSGPSAPPMDQLTFPGGSLRPHSPSPLARSPGLTHTILGPTSSGLDGAPSEHIPACSSLPCHAATPPATPPSRRRPRLKPPCTPPPPSRKVAQPPPNVALTRSRSHESQLGHRIEEPPSVDTAGRSAKKKKLLLNMHVNGGVPVGGCWEDSPSRSPLLSGRAPHVPLEEHGTHKNNAVVRRSSPQAVRRDIGLAVTHRFSTRSWLSQTCQVCQKSMMFGVKCKHCRLKCHNKCTKEAPSCRISFLPLAKIRRTESVPSDINNPVDRPTEAPQFGTLPKAKEHPPVLNPVDSSSNPSSTTSSTPSSPAPFQQGNPPSATPPPLNPSPKGPRESRFNFPAACYFQHRQQFIFPDLPGALRSEGGQHSPEGEPSSEDPKLPLAEEEGDEEEEGEDDVAEEEDGEDEGEEDEGAPLEFYGSVEVVEEEAGRAGGSDGERHVGGTDGLDELPVSRGGATTGGSWRGPISRKASQTSAYLQEWDIPFEQVDLGELIGKGRWGRVHRGRWHGEVAVRLLEIDGNNQDHLKLFKKEVMNYRQTRHENVVLFMGACMAPPHLAIITSFCKGRTLYSVVRDTKNQLDINKTRQIAQEIVKGMGYLHAKGIVHKDLKSKNVFHDTNKVVITDFGLFGISGVVREGGRQNELRLPRGWVCYLAPEIVRRMRPGVSEDRLPFSSAADVYAFGTIWYEMQVRDWPMTTQPVEATIWQVGSGEGIRKVLSELNLGKEVTEILSACWSYELRERPSFLQLADMLERLPKLSRRLSHPGHFWKSAECVS
ncbi:kinase suppressor of Ras 1-like isoform X1 [Paramormyrops kingsleyae]|uniref:kinase suppressor of Ras 1-like isoform X1 n=2 Tax=Paramormyrops kingsleyae TaxID=1676925 RepID=UPI000CD5CECE|nr:kinase suppressor of Ras 1-like isoform X1 [Paramormyrops kingsleyae]